MRRSDSPFEQDPDQEDNPNNPKRPDSRPEPDAPQPKRPRVNEGAALLQRRGAIQRGGDLPSIVDGIMQNVIPYIPTFSFGDSLVSDWTTSESSETEILLSESDDGLDNQIQQYNAEGTAVAREVELNVEQESQHDVIYGGHGFNPPVREGSFTRSLQQERLSRSHTI